MTARPTIRTGDPNLHAAGLRLFQISTAREQAELADSIAARAAAMVERLRDTPRDELDVLQQMGRLEIITVGRTQVDADSIDDYRHQATYARAVRDTLLWLTGEDPADRLTDTLDLPEA